MAKKKTKMKYILRLMLFLNAKKKNVVQDINIILIVINLLKLLNMMKMLNIDKNLMQIPHFIIKKLLNYYLKKII